MCFSQVSFYRALFKRVCVWIQAETLQVINNLSETLGWEEKAKNPGGRVKK